MIEFWEEERYPGIIGAHEKRIRCRLFWLWTFTIWSWDI